LSHGDTLLQSLREASVARYRNQWEASLLASAIAATADLDAYDRSQVMRAAFQGTFNGTAFGVYDGDALGEAALEWRQAGPTQWDLVYTYRAHRHSVLTGADLSAARWLLGRARDRGRQRRPSRRARRRRMGDCQAVRVRQGDRPSVFWGAVLRGIAHPVFAAMPDADDLNVIIDDMKDDDMLLSAIDAHRRHGLGSLARRLLRSARQSRPAATAIRKTGCRHIS